MNQTKGYDDNHLLQAMADGLVVRQFQSVDEAAKSVLNEPAGSNVDRLRRKFREQNWYETGLKRYVEGELAKRDLIKKTPFTNMALQIEETIRNPAPFLRRVVKILTLLLEARVDENGNKLKTSQLLAHIGQIFLPLLFLACFFDARQAFQANDGILFSRDIGFAVLCVPLIAISFIGGKWNLFTDPQPIYEKVDDQQALHREQRRNRFKKQAAEQPSSCSVEMPGGDEQ